ncbi:MAG: hypothetical protein VB106_09465 [Clostridiaceae bacterium]|nr:hypothetical protein [Clostridiaceae bacterium]
MENNLQILNKNGKGRLTLSWKKTNLVKMIRISISLNIAAVAPKL